VNFEIGFREPVRTPPEAEDSGESVEYDVDAKLHRVMLDCCRDDGFTDGRPTHWGKLGAAQCSIPQNESRHRSGTSLLVRGKR